MSQEEPFNIVQAPPSDTYDIDQYIRDQNNGKLIQKVGAWCGIAAVTNQFTSKGFILPKNLETPILALAGTGLYLYGTSKQFLREVLDVGIDLIEAMKGGDPADIEAALDNVFKNITDIYAQEVIELMISALDENEELQAQLIELIDEEDAAELTAFITNDQEIFDLILDTLRNSIEGEGEELGLIKQFTLALEEQNGDTLFELLKLTNEDDNNRVIENFFRSVIVFVLVGSENDDILNEYYDILNLIDNPSDASDDNYNALVKFLTSNSDRTEKIIEYLYNIIDDINNQIIERNNKAQPNVNKNIKELLTSNTFKTRSNININAIVKQTLAKYINKTNSTKNNKGLLTKGTNKNVNKSSSNKTKRAILTAGATLASFACIPLMNRYKKKNIKREITSSKKKNILSKTISVLSTPKRILTKLINKI
jgi:hypothetical protein